MMRSMFAGVSGLKAHQTRMDIIGNNIANVNSAGYKSSRATFQDMLSQTVRSATAPSTNRGGTNPQQVGLGVTLGSVDVKHTQGNTQSTGYITDLAIEGDGFFILGEGANRVYTRAGMFGLDNGTEGNLVSLVNGQRVLGYKADQNGVIDHNSTLQPLYISASDTISPRATDRVLFAGNLDNRYSTGDSVSRTVQVYDSRGREQTIVVDLVRGVGNTWEWDANWLLVSDSIPSHNNAIANKGDYTVVEVLPNEFAMHDLQGNAVAWSDDGRVWTSLLTSGANGANFEFETALSIGDRVTATSSEGQVFLTSSQSRTTRYEGVTATSTVDGTNTLVVPGRYTVALNGSDLELRDLAGTVVATSVNGTDWTPKMVDPAPQGPDFNLGVTLQEGSLVTLTGSASALTLTTKNPTTGGISLADRTIQFNLDGSYSGVEVNQIAFKPTFADDLDIVLDFSEFTQYADTFTGKFMNQTGYTNGALESYAIDQNGVIVGSFSNGLTRSLGQVALARFPNPAGLQRAGSTMFVDTPNSGSAQVGAAGIPGYGMIAPSSLEMSNVDLSEEFTDMIITQRGFQANSRIITTSDEILQELVNLKR